MIMTATRRLGFGIIGCGRFAEKAIVPAMRMSGLASVTALQKRSLEAATALAESLGIPRGYASVRECVRDPAVDAVFIASANSLHCEETIAAAEAGKHVLVEKPMAMNVRESQRMIDACRAAGVRLMVGHMSNFSPLLQRMRDIVRSGAIGPVVSARAEFVYDGRLSTRAWLVDRRLAGGGPVFDVGVHCLDALRFVLDDEVDHACGALWPAPTEERTEETAHISLRFARGAVGSIECSFRTWTRRRFIEVLGEDGMISAPDFTASDTRVQLAIETGTDETGLARRVEEIDVPNLYVKEIDHFVEAILSGRDPLTPGENGLANQKVLDRIIPPL